MVAKRLAIPITLRFKVIKTVSITPALEAGFIFCLQDLLRDRSDWQLVARQ
jgi:hypothetical protein